jgi:DivIVA domain-containing protein
MAAEPLTGGAGDAIVAGQAAPPAKQEALAEASEGFSAEWAERVSAPGFSITRWRPGYDPEEVDLFLEDLSDTFLGVRQPPLTAAEVAGKQFSTTRLRPGYDEEEVDAFLAEAEWRLTAQQRTATDDAD